MALLAQMKEALPSEHKAHAEHKAGPVVLTKELPAGRQEVHPPQVRLEGRGSS